MLRGIKPTPSLVTPGLPCTQQMLSFCSDSTRLTPSLRHPQLCQKYHHFGIYCSPQASLTKRSVKMKRPSQAEAKHLWSLLNINGRAQREKQWKRGKSR